jgi:hypothetical protein
LPGNIVENRIRKIISFLFKFLWKFSSNTKEYFNFVNTKVIAGCQEIAGAFQHHILFAAKYRIIENAMS